MRHHGKTVKIINIGFVWLVLLLMITGCAESTEISQNPSDITAQAIATIPSELLEQPEETAQTETAETIPPSENEINQPTTESLSTGTASVASAFSLQDVPAYSGTPHTEINDNHPYFTEADITTESFENYSELDNLGRCGVAYANIGQDLMPTEPRGEIGSVKPTGWHLVKYDNVDGKYLYNRCHLIAYMLAAENANPLNLITGTRYLNTQGMLPFETQVCDYVKNTGNHVLYRVTPIFEGDNLLANGVLMEAYSVEDSGAGIQFCIFAYNVQPSIGIDYATGDNWAESSESSAESAATVVVESQATPIQNETAIVQETPVPQETQGTTYVLNTNTMKFHYPTCSSVDDMKEKNKQIYIGNREDIINMGYVPCKRCNP